MSAQTQASLDITVQQLSHDGLTVKHARIAGLFDVTPQAFTLPHALLHGRLC